MDFKTCNKEERVWGSGRVGYIAVVTCIRAVIEDEEAQGLVPGEREALIASARLSIS